MGAGIHSGEFQSPRHRSEAECTEHGQGDLLRQDAPAAHAASSDQEEPRPRAKAERTVLREDPHFGGCPSLVRRAERTRRATGTEREPSDSPEVDVTCFGRTLRSKGPSPAHARCHGIERKSSVSCNATATCSGRPREQCGPRAADAERHRHRTIAERTVHRDGDLLRQGAGAAHTARSSRDLSPTPSSRPSRAHRARTPLRRSAHALCNVGNAATCHSV